LPWRSSKPQIGPELKGERLEPHDHYAPTRLQRQGRVDIEAGDLRALESRLELYVADDCVPFEDQVVATVVNLWLQYLQALDPREPHVAHDLSREEVLKQHLPIRGQQAVVARCHKDPHGPDGALG
jgi:hypothetical protein